MRKWFVNQVVPALLTGLIIAAVNLYVDVQLMKREMAVLRAELTDLWVQASDQTGRR